jgi:hypothetical protein
MKRHPSAGLEPSNTKASRARPTAPHPVRRPWGCWSTLAVLMAALAVLMVLMLATLASGFIVLRSTWRVGSVATRTPWPTFTPAAISAPQVLALVPADAGSAAVPVAAPVDPVPTLALPAATPTPWPTFTPALVSAANGDQAALENSLPPTATPTTTATSPPPPTAAATSPPPPTPTSPPPPPPPPLATDSGPAAELGWSFAGTRVETQPARKVMLVFGELINNTGAAQQLSQVTASFYDGQGNLLVADKSTTGLWPIRVIPQGARVPFALTIYDVTDVANFDLAVDAKAISTSARQDFEFLGVTEGYKGTQYCLVGALANPGGETAKSVVVAAILYDDQGNVLSFGTDNAAGLAGGQSVDFEVCLKSPPENTTSYELRAWGT